MTAKRNFWSVGGKLCCLCIVLVPFAFAGPVKAKGTLTILPAGTIAVSINDSGVVTGGEDSGLGFLRTPDGTITTFKVDDDPTGPQWINSSGVITGYYAEKSNVVHGFVRDADGAVTTFDAPGANGTYPSSINAQGVVTGSCICQKKYSGWVRAVNGTFTSIDVPAALATQPRGVNDKGEIVGFWETPLNTEHGFFRSADGKITTFDPPESQLTLAEAINNKGAITGSYSKTNSAWHGYIRHPDGTFTTFDAGGIGTGATAINDKGTVAGVFDNNKHRWKGFVRYPSGKIKLIAPPTSNGGRTFVSGINKDGVVVGYFTTRPDHHTWFTNYGFIWTP